MKNLVIGLGEVGTAIQSILKCDGIDSEDKSGLKYDLIHICFPYTESFVDSVKSYADYYEAKYVVVHSTVPIGTCDEHGWTHSPVRGVHPNLEQGIRTFVKYFGGKDSLEVVAPFVKRGIKCTPTKYAKTTEALKLWDTTQYGALIMLQKEIHDFCEENDLDFDLVYIDANQTYNDGYTKLKMPHVVRPFLKHMEGPIGGHCVLQNCKLLENAATAERILRVNTRL